MKITGNEKAIAEMIRANDDMPVTIYEVEEFTKVGTGEYGEGIIFGSSECFTTLEEAEKYFDEITEYADYAEFVKDSGCVLRKLIVDILSESPLMLDIEIEQTIKDNTEKDMIL